MADLIDRMGDVDALLTSANGTVVDRLERLAIRAVYRHRDSRPVPASTTLFERLAETFSVGPLAAVAAGTLCRQLPPWIRNPRNAAFGTESDDDLHVFGVIGTDPVSGASALTVQLE